MKYLFILFLFIGVSQFGFSQTEWKSETFYGTLKGMHFTATIDYKVDCEHATPFVRATLKDIEVYKFEFEGETYQYEYDLPIRADEGFLVLDGEITLVNMRDFHGTFELNEKHLSSKIGGGGNAMTADEFRFTNESEVTRIMGVNSCAGALEKLKFTTAILEITSVDIAKYDGDLRLNGRAINDILIEKINESVSSESNSNNGRSYLEEAKKKKNEYMEQLDREERMEQNRRAESERELNRIKRSNQDPTIKTIEVVEHEMGKITDVFNAEIDRQIAEDERKQKLAIQEYYEKERKKEEEYRKERDFREELHRVNGSRLDRIEPIEQAIEAITSTGYPEVDRPFLLQDLVPAKTNGFKEIIILPISFFRAADVDHDTREINKELTLVVHTYTPIVLDLTKVEFKNIGDWPRQIPLPIKNELREQGFTIHRAVGLVYLTTTKTSTDLTHEFNQFINEQDLDVIEYKHYSADSKKVAEEIYKYYENAVEAQKKQIEEDKQRNEEEARLHMEIEQALIVGELDDSIARRYVQIAPNGEYSEKMNLYIKVMERESKTFQVAERNADYFAKLLTIGNLLPYETVTFRYMGSKPIPENLGNLLSLKNLSLYKYGNNFGPFTLPSSVNKLQKLEKLVVSHNPLTSLPDSLGNFPELTILKASSCKLSHIPETIGELANLKELDLSYNQLSRIPETIKGLTKLEDLNLTYNHEITYLPERIVELSQLKSLKVNYNSLKLLPNNIGELKQLEELRLVGNGLNDLPQSICELYKLRLLNLGYNNLTFVSEDIGKLSNLRVLSLSNNEIQVLPNSIGELTQLEQLDLSDNKITSLPDGIVNLRKLKVLEITNLDLDKPSKKIIKALKKLNPDLEIVK